MVEYFMRYVFVSLLVLPLFLPAPLRAQLLEEKKDTADNMVALPPRAFEDMLVYVYDNDPRLKAERQRLKIADEQLSQANAGYRPSINANAGVGRQRIKVSPSDWTYGDDLNTSLVATQPLFSGFSTLEGKRAAEARVLAARARLRTVEQNVLFSAIAGWLEIAEKEKMLALTEKNLNRMKEYAAATRERFDAGDSTRTDIAQGESRLAQAEARYAVALADRNSAHDSFERNTGMKATSLDYPDLPANLPATRTQAEAAASENPQTEQAAQESKASEHDIQVAESSLWPSIFLRGAMGESRSPALGLSRLRNDSITLNASIPLYQSGAEYSRVREARLAREQNRHAEIDTHRDVLEQARIAWNNYVSAQRVIEASQRASVSAMSALNGVREEQKQGLRTLTDVLDEEAEYLNTELTHVQAQKDVRLEAYRLLAATGRLHAESLRLPVEAYDPTVHYDDVRWRWVGLSAE